MDETLISRGILPLGPITSVLLCVKIKPSKRRHAQLVVLKGEDTRTDEKHTNKMLQLAFLTSGQVIKFEIK